MLFSYYLFDMFVCMFVCNNVVRRSIIHTELAKLYSQKVIYSLANLAALVEIGHAPKDQSNRRIHRVMALRVFSYQPLIPATFIVMCVCVTLPNENKISYRWLDQPWVSDGNVEIIIRNFTCARVVGWTFYYSQRAGPYPRRVFSH